MGREGDRRFPFLLVVLWDRVTTVLVSVSLVTFPGCPCPSVAGVGWWRWGWWWWGAWEEGAGSSPFQLLVHLVSDGTLGTGEPVCPSIKVAASE